MLSRLASYFVIAIIAVAIWRGNDGDMGRVADSVMGILNHGADFVTTIWVSLFGTG